MLVRPKLEVELATTELPLGETLRGVVVMRQPAGEAPVKLSVGWRATGGARARTGSGDLSKYAVGDGGERRYSFQVPVRGAHPLSYAGEIVKVTWSVRAEVEVFGPNASAEAELVVVRGPRPPELPRRLVAEYEEIESRKQSTGPEWWIVGPALFLFGLPGIAALLATVIPNHLVRRADDLGGALVTGLFLLALAALSTYFGLRRWLAARKFGRPTLRVEPLRPHLGGDVTFRVELAAGVALETAEIFLECRETHLTGSGKNRTARDALVHAETLALAPAAVTAPGRQTLEARFTLPASAPPSFWSMNGNITWVATLRLAPEGPGLWDERRPVLVWYAEPGPYR